MGKQFGWGCFLVIAVPVSILTFILDVVFHKTLWPVLFGNSYPAIDYPQLAACLFEIAYRPMGYNQDNAATTSASVPVSSVG